MCHTYFGGSLPQRAAVLSPLHSRRRWAVPPGGGIPPPQAGLRLLPLFHVDGDRYHHIKGCPTTRAIASQGLAAWLQHPANVNKCLMIVEPADELPPPPPPPPPLSQNSANTPNAAGPATVNGTMISLRLHTNDHVPLVTISVETPASRLPAAHLGRWSLSY